jgi:hypothetical protein
MNAKLVGRACALLIGGLFLQLQSSPQKKDVIEIRQQDLFALHGWKSADVSVFGLQLGMSRAEVVSMASAKGKAFTLVCSSTSTMCTLFPPAGAQANVSFYFDTADRVSEIYIDWRENHRVSEEWLHGYTRQLVNHYTDELREKLLGPADGYTREIAKNGADTLHEKLLTRSDVQEYIEKDLQKQKDRHIDSAYTYYCFYKKTGMILYLQTDSVSTIKPGSPIKFRKLDSLVLVQPELQTD